MVIVLSTLKPLTTGVMRTKNPPKNTFKCRWKHVVFDILCIRCREVMEGRGRTMHREGGFKVGHPASAPSKSIGEALR